MELQKIVSSALRKFKNECNKSIMINVSDKDSKLVIVKMEDYKRRVKFELEKKKELTTIIINVAFGCSFPLFKYTLGNIKSDLKLFNKHTP